MIAPRLLDVSQPFWISRQLDQMSLSTRRTKETLAADVSFKKI